MLPINSSSLVSTVPAALPIENRADIQETNRDKLTLLEQACAKGDLATVASLIANGAKVEDKGGLYTITTPLLAACANGHPKVVALLIKKGAAIEGYYYSHHPTPFKVACANGHLTTAALLLELGANIKGHKPRSNTPLEAAYYKRDARTLAFLIKNGASIEGTALQAARSRGDLSTAAFLIEKGADMEKTGNSDKPPT